MSFAYLPFYTGDYFRDTRGLSMAGHGCYILLLTYCWDSQGPLPLDDERIAGICEARSQEERNTMGRILLTYFVRMDDGWYNRRMQREIERCHVIGLARKAAGAKGYQAKAKHLPSKSQANARQVPLSPSPSPTSSPSPSPRRSKDKCAVGAFAPPEWVPKRDWEDFDQMRKAISGKGWTERAKALAVNTLAKHRASGNDPSSVLRQSVERSWKGLFPVDSEREPTQAQKRAKVAKAIFQDRKENDDAIDGTAERIA